MQSEGKTIIHSLQRRGKFEKRGEKKSPPIPKEEKVGTKKTKQNKVQAFSLKEKEAHLRRSINFVHFHFI
jgi:hypothetical protein